MKSILFVINEAGEFVELSKVALAIQQQGYKISFLFASASYVNLENDSKFCEANNFNFYYPFKVIKSLGENKPTKAHASLFLKKYPIEIENQLGNGYIPYSFLLKPKRKSYFFILPTLLIVSIFSIFSFLNNLLSKILKLFERLFKKIFINSSKTICNLYNVKSKGIQNFYYAYKVFKSHNYQLLIFGQEFPGSVNSLLTKLCNKRNIPTLIIPFAVGTTKEIVESLFDKKNFEVSANIINYLASLLYPKWVNFYKGKKMLRLAGKQIFFLELMGLAPEHPWLPNNSFVTKIAVESQKMFSYYQSMKFPIHQLSLTGSLSDDVLVGAAARDEGIKRKVCQKMNLDPEKPILLCAWPTDQFSSRFVSLEFATYEQLCKAWAQCLKEIEMEGKYSVIIRPHPVTNKEIVSKILKQCDLDQFILYDDTIQLISICDLFVACISSTLRWAIAKGIPVINYDCYQYGYTDFDANGVFNVNEFKSFSLILKELTQDKQKYENAKQAQQQCANDWGMLDGLSKKRIVNLINKLVKSESVMNLENEYYDPNIIEKSDT
ncbi:hypothetical protein [Legionella pneumophila]|uniref:hypothetical protein n=1 Tax=Legionella pneumophila TaxID=446 RepID=UPI0004833AE1|nr:hypothetical protein [Legionella pneumophila]STX65055.1 Uncharacterised protein [Legionella pneumophila]STX65061.1 Uncharacterised protein [Legionella pneumophila]STY21418.1 Uncharacterised protein [Legionella pneumophila]HAT2140626.1 hypothetical protein [Legionella pneumophila]HAT2149912.1 hypothetical protein [Legionella pneumophila]